MAELALRLDQVEGHIRDLTAERRQIQTAMVEAAGYLKGAEPTSVARIQHLGTIKLTSRPLELAKLLRKFPDADLRFFAVKLYGEDTQQTRTNISGLFVRLKKAGFVVSDGRGRFSFTEEGEKSFPA